MRTALAPLAAVALVACAPIAPTAPRLPAAGAVGVSGSDCFRSADMRGHTFADDSTMYVDVLGKGVYRIRMRNGCLAGATSSDPLVTRRPPGASFICRPIDMDVSVARIPGGFETPCIVDSIARMTPAEVAALPPRLRP